MKIIFVNRYFYPDHSATSQILADLAFYLAEQGFDVSVVTSRQRYDDPSAKLLKTETVRGVKIRRVWTTNFGRLKLGGRKWDYLTFYASAAVVLACFLRKDDRLVCMTDPPLFSVIAAAIGKYHRSRVMNWIQDLFPETAHLLKVETLNDTITQWIRGLRNWSLSGLALNVVISEGMASRLAVEGIELDQIRVIPNWADGGHIQPLPKEKNPLIQAWGLKGKFIAEYSGNMGRAHEFMTIIGAAEILKAEENLLFLFIGDGSERAWVEAEFIKRGLKKFLFKPYQSYEILRESLGLADVHLISLRTQLEGCVFPSKLYGALAAGKPVIFVGDPDGDIGSILAEENCGYAVNEGNSKALSEKIKDLMYHQSLLEEQGTHARAVFDRLFDKRYGLKEWQKILK